MSNIKKKPFINNDQHLVFNNRMPLIHLKRKIRRFLDNLKDESEEYTDQEAKPTHIALSVFAGENFKQDIPAADLQDFQPIVNPALKPDSTANYPKNPTRKDFYNKAHSQGWTIIDKGFPDYLLVKDCKGKLSVALVQLKKHRGRALKKQQEFILSILAQASIPCYRYSPITGYERINLKQPQEE